MAQANGDVLMHANRILERLRPEAHAVWGDWDGHDVPSASFVHFTVEATEIRIVNLGDCRVLYEVDGGPVQSFGSCGVAALDSALLSEYRALRDADRTLSHAEAWKSVVPTIRANRGFMNQPGGYWILSPHGEGLVHVEQASVGYRTKARVLLWTDGLYRLVDTYGRYNERALFEHAFEDGALATLVDELREIESHDPDAKAYPRVKLQDDATALAVMVRA